MIVGQSSACCWQGMASRHFSLSFTAWEYFSFSRSIPLWPHCRAAKCQKLSYFGGHWALHYQGQGSCLDLAGLGATSPIILTSTLPFSYIDASHLILLLICWPKNLRDAMSSWCLAVVCCLSVAPEWQMLWGFFAELARDSSNFQNAQRLWLATFPRTTVALNRILCHRKLW